MNMKKREITKEQYDRGVQNHGYLTREDFLKVFTDAERLGYGAISFTVSEEDGRFYVWYDIYDSCD